MQIDWGTFPDWLSGVGGLLSVVAVVATALLERRRRVVAEDAAEQLAVLHRSEVARAVADQLTALIQALDNEDPSKFPTMGVGNRQPFVTVISLTRRAIIELQALSKHHPLLELEIIKVAKTCEYDDMWNSAHEDAVIRINKLRARLKPAEQKMRSFI